MNGQKKNGQTKNGQTKSLNALAAANRNRNMNFGKVALTAALTVLGTVPAAVRAAWDIYPEATAEIGADDNIRLNPTTEDSATTGIVEAKMNARRVTETGRLIATVAARRAEYGSTTLDGVTSGGANVAADVRGERLTYGVLGNYSNQPLRRTGAIDLETGALLGSAEQLAIEEQIRDTGADPDLEIGFIEDRIRQERAFISPFVLYRLSNRNQLRVSGEFSDNSYSGDNIIGLEDSQQFGGTLSLMHQLSERSMLTARVASRKFEPDLSPEVRRNEVTLRYSRQASELTRYELEAGVSNADSENGQEDTVGIYRAALYRQFNQGELALTASRNNWPSGFGNIVQTDMLSANWTQPLTERWGLDLKGTFSSTDSNLQDATNPNDRDFADIETRVSYRLVRAWQVGAGHRFRWADRKLQPKDATGNAYFLFVSYSPPRPF